MKRDPDRAIVRAVFLILAIGIVTLLSWTSEAIPNLSIWLGRQCRAFDLGEWAYLGRPDYVMRAIRVSNVEYSYDRESSAQALHEAYRAWRRQGCSGSFLKHLSPNRSNRIMWMQAVALNIALQVANEESQ